MEIIQGERYLNFKFNENELIKYLIKFAEYREGIGSLNKEDKELISEYVMHSDKIKL